MMKMVNVMADRVYETINNGELLKLAIQYLKSKGIPVRK